MLTTHLKVGARRFKIKGVHCRAIRYIEFAVAFAIISVFGHTYRTVVLKNTIPAGAVIQATDIERRGFYGCTCTIDYATDIRQVVGHRALKPISGAVHLSDVSK